MRKLYQAKTVWVTSTTFFILNYTTDNIQVPNIPEYIRVLIMNVI